MARSSGRGRDARELPRGIEVLVKKAAVDAEFRALLLEVRAEAAKLIALDLDPAEAAILEAIPAAQLETTIASTKVDEKARPAFLGKAATVMIAALGVGSSGCNTHSRAPAGIPPDRVPKATAAEASPAKTDEDRTEADDGKE